MRDDDLKGTHRMTDFHLQANEATYFALAVEQKVMRSFEKDAARIGQWVA